MNQDDKNDLLTSLMDALKQADKAYALDGPMMMTVKLPDSTFRKKTVLGMEFLPLEARVGARDTIFCFTPEDPQDFNSVEVGSKDMDTCFPLFLEDMKQWMLKRFMAGGASRGANIDNCENVRDLVGMMFAMEREDLKEDEAADDSEMAAHPMFGMF